MYRVVYVLDSLSIFELQPVPYLSVVEGMRLQSDLTHSPHLLPLLILSLSPLTDSSY